MIGVLINLCVFGTLCALINTERLTTFGRFILPSLGSCRLLWASQAGNTAEPFPGLEEY